MTAALGIKIADAPYAAAKAAFICEFQRRYVAAVLAKTCGNVSAAPHVARPHTLTALHQAVIDRLDANMVKLFRPLIEAYPDSVTSEQLASASGYTVNGHFNNMKGRLRTLGLATYPRGNEVRAAALLFPEGIS